MSRINTLKKIGLLLPATFALTLLSIAVAGAWSVAWNQPVSLTTNSYDDFEPQISGDNAVWTGYGGPGATSEIYFFNGSTVSNLTANSFSDWSPQISGNNAVWRGYGGPGDTSEIYFFNGSTVSTLTANSFNDYDPQISGNDAVWYGRGGPGNTYEIYFFDGSAVSTLTANSFNDWTPQISGNNVVWYGAGGPAGTHEIYLYNGSTVTTITANSFEDYSPQISGNNVVWYGDGGPAGTYEIYFYNGSTVTTLTANSFNDFDPQISGNNVVWYGDGGPAGTREIYFYNGSTVTTITANSFHDLNPQISGNNLVWRGDGGTGGTGEIYTAQMEFQPPTNPAVTGATPAKGVWTKDNTILVNLAGAADASSGVDGFSVAWSGSSSTLSDEIKDLEESAVSALSPAQPDGDSYFHLRTRDNAGNWTSTVHYGPFKVDRTKPKAAVKVASTVSGAGLTARFRVAWSGSDAGSGVKSYDVAYKIGKRGKWKTFKRNVTTRRARFTAQTGKNYYFRARAKDKAGNLGLWSKVKRTIVN